MIKLRLGQTTAFFNELKRQGEIIEGEFTDLFREYHSKKLKFLIYSDTSQRNGEIFCIFAYTSKENIDEISEIETTKTGDNNDDTLAFSSFVISCTMIFER